MSHLKGKTHVEAVRNTHDGREPSRDELQRFNISQIRDVPISVADNNSSNEIKAAKEKQKALKRRCRKMKQRMILRGKEWEDNHKIDANQSIESTNKAKFRRNLKELDRLYNNHSKTAWSSVAIASLERSLGEITRAYSKLVRYINLNKIVIVIKRIANKPYILNILVFVRSDCISSFKWIRYFN